MIEINLLPVREERRRADLQQQLVLLVGTLAGALLLAGACHWWVSSSLGDVRSRSAALEKEIDRFGAQLQQVEQYRAQKQEIESKLAVIERLDASRSGPVRILDELAVHTPERVWLTRVDANQGRMTIEGLSLDNELVALFITALNDSPYFRDVELEETELYERDKLKLNQFRLKARLSTPGIEDEPEDVVTTASAKGARRAKR
jgi:type IV pilus assembly protein PilN